MKKVITFLILITSFLISGSTLEYTKQVVIPIIASCTDGIQNGDEIGIDFGGSSCNSCESSVPVMPTFGHTFRSTYSDYNLVWSDDFTDILDTDKWSFHTGCGCPNLCGWGNNELQYYTDKNLSFVGENLAVTPIISQYPAYLIIDYIKILKKKMIKLIDTSEFSKGFEELGIKLFTLKNKNGIVSQITNYGGRVVNLFVPDKNGVFEDVVLGYDSAKDYLEKPDHFFGAIIGRYGNRIADGKISIENNEFLLAKNEAESQLHGGEKGFHAVIWKAKQISASSLELTHFSKHLDQGFPGNLEVKVVYTLTDESELQIEYFAVSDAKTVINLTNHSYFNLSGDFNKSIENHLVQIKANSFLPVNDKMIPLGNLESVRDSPFDFRELKTIKQGVNKQHKQIVLGSGFDHNFVLDNPKSGFIAKVIDSVSSRVLEVYTTEPGVQFYSGNHLNNIEGKNGILYQKRAAFCLETQHFPNSPNQSSFPSTLLLPEEKYFSRTIYKFSVHR